MAFRHPARVAFDRLFSELDKKSAGHGLEAAQARANKKLLAPYVELLEAERDRATPGQHFVFAVLGVVANQLAATLRFSIEQGEQQHALDGMLQTVREQVAARVDKPAMAPLFFPGLDPKAGAR